MVKSYGSLSLVDSSDIDQVTSMFLASANDSGVTKQTAGWHENTPVPPISASLPYLWYYASYSANGVTVSETDPVIIGRYGADGRNGVTIDKVEYSKNGTDWSETEPTLSKGEWLYVKTTYTDETSVISKSYAGTDGHNGLNGRGIERVDVTYGQSANTTDEPATWYNNVPSWDGSKPYYWVKTVTTYDTDPPSTYTYKYIDYAMTDANSTAHQAATIANNLNQWFWYLSEPIVTSEGTISAGVRVTQVSSSVFKDNPDTLGGPNTLVRSDGIYLNDGLKILSKLNGSSLEFFDPTTSKVRIKLGLDNNETGNSLKFYYNTENAAQKAIVLNNDNLKLYSLQGYSVLELLTESNEGKIRFKYPDSIGRKSLELTKNALSFYANDTDNSRILQIGYDSNNIGFIQSGNYVRGSDSIYGDIGTCINLTNGDFISPNFRIVQEEVEGGPDVGAYFKGAINATSGNIAGNVTIGGTTTIGSIGDARNYADNYLTVIDGTTGISVHNVNNVKDYINITSNMVSIVSNEIPQLKATINNDKPLLQIGADSVYHLQLVENSLDFIYTNNQKIASIALNTIGNLVFTNNASSTESKMTMTNNSIELKSEVNDSDGYAYCDCDLDGYAMSFSSRSSLGGQASLYISSEDKHIAQAYGLIKLETKSTWIVSSVVSFDSSLTGGEVQMYFSDLPRGSSSNHLVLEYSNRRYKVLQTGNSSKRYKHNIKLIEEPSLNPHNLYNIDVVQFIYNKNHLNKEDQRYNMLIPGFIAENVYEQYPVAVDLLDGRPENWNERFIIPPMLALIQEQHEDIEKLKQEIKYLKNK